MIALHVLLLMMVHLNVAYLYENLNFLHFFSVRCKFNRFYGIFLLILLELCNLRVIKIETNTNCDARAECIKIGFLSKFNVYR